MRRADKQWKDMEATEQSFLPEEGAESAAAAISDLRERVVALEQQVKAQYTATAAYATLSQQGLDQTRAESRADLDRINATLLGLIDRLRAEVAARLDALATGQQFGAGAGASAGAAPAEVTTRLASMEERIHGLMRALEASVHENMVLRQQIGDLQRKVMQADGWLVSGGGPSDLTLR